MSKEKEEKDYVLISGSQDCSVILACGLIRNNNGTYSFSGYKNYYVENIIQNDLAYGRLTLKLQIKDNRKYVITGVYAQQGETNAIPYNSQSNSGRDAGAHWFAANISTEMFTNINTITIHEFHQENKNNDSWESNMIGDSSIKSIMIVVVGYIE